MWCGELAIRLKYDEHKIVEYDGYGIKIKTTVIPASPAVERKWNRLRRIADRKQYERSRNRRSCPVCGHVFEQKY